MTNLDTPPVVIRRRSILGFVLLFLTGIPLLLTLVQAWFTPNWQLPNGHTFLSGPAAFVFLFLLGVLVLLRPARLTLAPEGLAYESLLRLYRRSWRWQDVSYFEVIKVWTGKARRNAIGFTGSDSDALPMSWELPLAEVLALLNAARTRWGRHTGPPVAAWHGSSDIPARHAMAPAAPPTPLSTSLILTCWLVALLLIGVGLLIGYLYGYKDSIWLEGTYVLIVVFGWLVLLFTAIASLPGTDKIGVQRPEPLTGLGKLWRFVRRLGFAAGGLGWLALMVGSLVVVDQQRSQRVARILATEPTATAIATVTELRERSSRSGTVRSTLIEYQAGTTQVHQAIPETGRYAVGEQLRVKYAVAYPDMFTVVE